MGNAHFELMHPWWLAAVAAVVPLWWYWRRSLIQLPPRRRIASLAMRTALVAVVAAAMAGPRVHVPSRHQCVVPVIDRAEGIPTASYQVVESFKEAAAAGKVSWMAAEEFARSGESDAWPDMTAAIAAARADIPDTDIGQIVVFAGNRPHGDRAAASLRGAGAAVCVVPLVGPQPEASVSAVEAPRESRQGEPLAVGVILDSTHDDRGTLELQCNGGRIESRTVEVKPGQNRFEFTTRTPTGTTAELMARIEGFKDTFAENNVAGAAVVVLPKPRVLLVESRPALGEHLAKVLKGANIEVDACLPKELPVALDRLAGYELLVLSNVPAAALPGERQELIRRYVRDGGGLIAVGGDQAFTAGGYRGAVLEEVLPVISEGRPRPKPTLAMVLVLDCSGSMEGKSIALAKQATQRAIEMLGPRDQVGVLAFEDTSRWVAPLQRCTDKQAIVQQLTGITAGGGTDMYPAMEKAYLALRDATADLKHMIVLTDGVSHPADFDALARQIAADGISVSTVGVGPEPARPLLKDIAERAKGHSYFCDDAAEVPQIFALETISAGKVGINEEPFFPKAVHPGQSLRRMDLTHMPTLLGYVETRARPESEIELASAAGDPLLAVWRFGRGTSIAFTSDIQSRWAAAWLRWPEFGPFWVQLVRQAMRRPARHDCRVRLDRSDDTTHVTLDALDADGRFINGADASVSIADGGQAVRRIRLAQVAPGRYTAGFDTAAPGTYLLETAVSRQGKLLDTQRLAVVSSYRDAWRPHRVADDSLRAMADAGGCRYSPKPDDWLGSPDGAASRTVDLWTWLLAVAAALLLLDLAVRRAEWARSVDA